MSFKNWQGDYCPNIVYAGFL